MKTLKYRLCMIIIGMMIVNLSANANEPRTTVELSKVPDRDKNKSHPKGPRIPGMRIPCTIDYESNCISLSIQASIISYELWDEEGETSIAAYASDSELVQFMAGLDGVYQLRLVTDEYIYTGYIEL